MAWTALGGLLLLVMNALMKRTMQDMSSFQAQFLRYLFGLLLILPLVLRDGGPGALRPNRLPGQLWRGVVHAGALTIFFIALQHVPLADTTAILFTAPIFVLAGAALLLRERVTGARWAAAATGFAGMVIVVWPHLGGGGSAGWWSLVMLAAAPLFAASQLISKALTRYDSPTVIVCWQNITITLITLPMAWWVWQSPTPLQWAVMVLCGLLGNAAHWAWTRAFSMADISAMQPIRFLDLVWASALGMLLFGETPTPSTLAGGLLIVAATVWLARREATERARRLAR
jgi:drug/metabolite transporter (DMT)-like permease